MPEIHLLCLCQETRPLPAWSLGRVVGLPATPQAIANWLEKNSPANRFDEWWLFWDLSLGNPDIVNILSLCERTEDVYHAGLRLGLNSLPCLHDFVNPTWLLNRDPSPDIEATSWRLSLRACLVRGAVLAQLGGPDPQFATLSGASLELGHRWITHGAFMRHIPDLVVAQDTPMDIAPILSDEFGFVLRRYGRVWTIWALMRALANNYFISITIKTFRQVWRWPNTTSFSPFRRLPVPGFSYESNHPTITILIPTLDRYPYLFRLLEQLRQQTISPLEIIVVDQTTSELRQTDWPQKYLDLPLQVIWRDGPGQCSSRNAGLQQAKCDYILFLDDDDEIQPDLLVTHLDFLKHFRPDASCGIAEEFGAGELPRDFRYSRSSDVFPTNNTLLYRKALADSGLFDLAYEKGSRADGDLGMRLYLSGKQLLLNPSACVLHLHAPHGGLRQHKARTITRGSSQNSLWQRHLLAPTEGYLWWRYFTPSQVWEALYIRTFASLRGTGSRRQRLGRLIIMLIYLPVTYYQNRQRLLIGKSYLRQHPTIPQLDLTR